MNRSAQKGVFSISCALVIKRLINLTLYKLNIELLLKYPEFVVLEPIFEKFALFSSLISQHAVPVI